MLKGEQHWDFVGIHTDTGQRRSETALKHSNIFMLLILGFLLLVQFLHKENRKLWNQ